MGKDCLRGCDVLSQGCIMFSLSFTTSEQCSLKKDTYPCISYLANLFLTHVEEFVKSPQRDQLFNSVLHYHFQSLVLQKLIIPHQVKGYLSLALPC